MDCNRDCLNCPYPDCIDPPLSIGEYRDLEAVDKEILHQKTEKQRRALAYQKAYYEANKDRALAYQKAYYEANKDRIAASKKAYYEANKYRIAASQKAYYEANKDKLGCQAAIKVARQKRNWSQEHLASQLGVTRTTLSLWELGKVPAQWDKLCAVLPELEKCKLEKEDRYGKAKEAAG